MERDDLMWLAGLLEGEGSFFRGPPSEANRPRISVHMTDEDVIQRIATLLDCNYHTVAPRCERWKVSYRVILRGKQAVTLMGVLKPLMGNRRRSQIERALVVLSAEKSSLHEEANRLDNCFGFSPQPAQAEYDPSLIINKTYRGLR